MGRHCGVAGISPANKIPFSKGFSIRIYRERIKEVMRMLEVLTDQRNMKSPSSLYS